MAFEGSLMADDVMGKWKYTGSVGYNKLLAVGHFPNFIHQIFVKDKTEINPRSHKIRQQVSYHPILYVFRTPTQFKLTSQICLWGMKLDFIHIVKCLMAQNNIRSDHKRSDKFCRPPANHL